MKIIKPQIMGLKESGPIMNQIIELQINELSVKKFLFISEILSDEDLTVSESYN